MQTLTIQHSIHTFHARGARSLLWAGDHLVDWLLGVRWSLDGGSERIAPEADASFDAAVARGPYAVVHQRLGTRAQLLHEGRVLRELSRDEYCADAYEYPACLWQARSGRTLLAHCPEHYNRIEIEDAHTGQRLTASDARKPEDFFHSRLQVNPAATRLLSAGWCWHPWDMVGHVDLAAALEDPRQLDDFHFDLQARTSAEQGSACWQTDHRILVSGSAEDAMDDVPDDTAPRLRPNGIALYDLCDKRVVSDVVLPYTPGTMMPVGHDKVITFNEHPRLVSLTSAAVLHAWNDLPSGNQTSSIIWGIDPPPPLAIDSTRNRFALLRDDEVTIVSLELP